MFRKLRQLSTGFGVPATQRAIGGSGQDAFAGSIDGNRRDVGFVALEQGEFVTASRIPDASDFITARTDNPATVGRYGNRDIQS